MACKTCNKKRNTAIGKVKRRKRRARVGSLSTGTKVALGILVLGVGAVVYLKFSDITNKVVIKKVEITGINASGLSLTVHVANLSSASLPFSGFNGNVILNQNTDLGSVLIESNTTIPAHGNIELPCTVAPNLFALASVIKGLITAFKSKNFSLYRMDLKGHLFVGDISVPIDYRFI
jgi:LEA14-like dessication related protein